MATKLFVGSLPWAIDDQGLEDLFKDFGDVLSAKVIMDRETGRSKGFGFVSFNDETAAKAALGECSRMGWQCGAVCRSHKTAAPQPSHFPPACSSRRGDERPGDPGSPRPH